MGRPIPLQTVDGLDSGPLSSFVRSYLITVYAILTPHWRRAAPCSTLHNNLNPGLPNHPALGAADSRIMIPPRRPRIAPPLSFRSSLALLLLGCGTVPLVGAEVTVRTPPVGAVSTALSVGTSSTGFPLLAEPVFSDVVLSNEDAEVRCHARPQLTSGQAYYLEVLDGPFAGDRFDVNDQATAAGAGNCIIVKFAATGASTRSGLPTNSLVGARVVVRPHLTLGGLGEMIWPGLVGSDNPDLADGVGLYVDGALRFFHLRGDQRTWRDGKKGRDESQRVVALGTGALVVVRSSPQRSIQVGAVRTTPFRINLRSGTHAYSTGFPVAMSPIEVGAFVDATLPASARWTGSDVTGQGDAFAVYATGQGEAQVYQLGADGVNWTASAGGSSVAALPVLPGAALILVTRRNADPDYFVLPPFTR